MNRELLPPRPEDPPEDTPYPNNVWLHENCDAAVYDYYVSNGWGWDDLEDYYRMGDSSLGWQPPAEPSVTPEEAAAQLSLFDEGNCVALAWAGVVGLNVALQHMASAPPPYWNGAHMVRSLIDWCQIGGGRFSLGPPLSWHPVMPSFTPYFAVTNRGGVPHVDLVYLMWQGSDLHSGNFNVSGEVVQRDVFINRHLQSGLVW